ncbi:PP2C family serine/threonine-protein phosphatase [Actinoplanes sp. NPDC026619]|uniref:PP2C family serine/threonine-protein phosphatase n=1 Tax=Actinoplanes sp. NPDC026619 TaxID=3155798 RepID=UPI003409269C
MSGPLPPESGMVRKVLGYLGRPPSGSDAPADGVVVRQVGQPLTVGEPIVRSPEDDALTVSSWTTQPRLSADGGALGPLTVRAASVSGRRHARQGASREDAYAICPASGGAVVAVADGVGHESARYSAVGAQIAAVEACRLVAECLDRNWAVDADDLCRVIGAAMIQRAGWFVPVEYEPRSLATTLTVVWVATDGRYAGFRIGDGEIFELTGAGLAPAGPSAGGAFTETSALPASWSAAETFAGRLPPESALVVVTDGLSVPMRSPDVAAHLSRRWHRVPTIVEFLDDVSFERRGESDDRTAVCVWFRPRAAR